MRLVRLHRQLSALMAFAALTAFGAGYGMTSPEVILAALTLGVALVWQMPAEWGVWLDRIARLVAVALFAWILYVAFVLAGDFLLAVLALLLFLLASETLRPVDARNDLRLYSLSFALLIAATAYYPGPLFAGAFVAYIGLATLALMVGHLRRQAERFHIADVRIGRPFLVATAALSAITVLMSVALFVVFPRLPRNWIGPARGAAQQAMAGFGNSVSLAEYGGRIYPNPEIVFRVEFSSEIPADPGGLHWRGRSFDHFDGVRWSHSRTPPFSPPPQFYRDRWAGGADTYQIFGGPGGVRILFGLHPILGIQPRSAVRPVRTPTGDVAYYGADEPVYEVTSAAALPPAEVLRSVPDVRNDPGLGAYLQLPRLDPRIPQLADSLTRGQPTQYDQVRAVESYFKREFAYTLDLPSNAAEASLAGFLFDRREGHCEYFSTAMAILLRSVGIPARNVNGFLGGEWSGSGKYLAVTQNDAHSWVEVWFPELGWVPFDPTPSASRAEVAGTGAATGWSWPVRFWLDGVEHQWFKWVLYYDLDKQLGVLRQVSDMFSGSPIRAPRGGGFSLRPLLPWAIALIGALVLFWLLRGQRRRSLSAEARLYLALRDAYARAGFAPDGADTPLAFREALRRAEAPGVRDAERLLNLYLRARFADEAIGPEGRAEMADALAEVRRAVQGRGRKLALVASGAD